MSEIHKFLFDGVPVRGVLVRLTDAWTEILRRRAAYLADPSIAEPWEGTIDRVRQRLHGLRRQKAEPR